MGRLSCTREEGKWPLPGSWVLWPTVTAHVCLLPPQPHSRDHLPARSPSSNATPEVPGAWRWCPQCRLDSLPRLSSWPRHRPISGAGMTWLLQSEPHTPHPRHMQCAPKEGKGPVCSPLHARDKTVTEHSSETQPVLRHCTRDMGASPSHPIWGASELPPGATDLLQGECETRDLGDLGPTWQGCTDQLD